eukprot:CAMPEP_0119407988 /NCGR_PEP_ID=MMETSP1335-20130426/1688_1 /TAXON_ID=259385 /ORGANISM="Chrysoculter rhomboideus, Strain RCC1486" /LENGTH=154 /DNA_ID=CAMNT_0007432167 /DNA_START=437 /DNA_END=902 /DNA_ORIENTATION=+
MQVKCTHAQGHTRTRRARMAAVSSETALGSAVRSAEPVTNGCEGAGACALRRISSLSLHVCTVAKNNANEVICASYREVRHDDDADRVHGADVEVGGHVDSLRVEGHALGLFLPLLRVRPLVLGEPEDRLAHLDARCQTPPLASPVHLVADGSE